MPGNEIWLRTTAHPVAASTAPGLRFDRANEPLTVRSSRVLAILSKALGELNQSHFLSFNAAPSNVVTIACIRPSLVM